MKLWQPKIRTPRRPISRTPPTREKNKVAVPAIKEITEIEPPIEPKIESSFDSKPPQTSPIGDKPLKKESVLPTEEAKKEEKKTPHLAEFEAQPTVRKYRVLTKRQRRRQSLSVAVSEEEEELLRSFAASKEKSFSSWARETLFKAMGRKIPKRPT